MAQQLPLDIHLRVEHRLDNFLTSSAQAQELVEKLAAPTLLKADEAIVIYGENGAGKTHLLQGLCQLAGDLDISCGYLPLNDLRRAGAGILEGLDQLDLICIDDIHCIAGNAEWERGLFNLFNLSRQHHCQLLMTSQQRPADSHFELADLTSRLTWGLIYPLPNLDQHERKQLLLQRALELGLSLDESACDYILQRSQRQTSSLMDFLDQLDQHSLADQRRITIPLIRELMQINNQTLNNQ